MLPRWHIFWGAVFTAILYYYIPNAGRLNLFLVFLASFLIDFDHYFNGLIKNKAWTLKANFKYHNKKRIEEEKDIKREIKKRGDFHLFHTIEFHTLVGLLGLLWVGFFYIFIGMVFHSLLDIIYLSKTGKMHRREFIFFNWLAKKI